MANEWNDEEERRTKSDVEQAYKHAKDNLRVITEYTPSSVLNIQGASAHIQTAKTAITNSINTLRRISNTIRTRIDTIIKDASASTESLGNEKHQVVELKKQISEAQTLYNLRKEQADVLRNKYEGNYHSSWIGLWRPLTEQSRTGLLVASIVFGIIALVSLIFIVREYRTTPAILRPVYENLSGGFLNSLRRK